ncbi:hypothetical protein M3201_09490 [Paenibacillus motobuensis]|uniref:hypothetical protein n=1 Tax=Paenibacillus TaxID=44249 RepID=UPI002041D0DD|nr:MULTISPECIES: hypothetical protein [Paenibacillus]MCM3039926.1 hypothetical protein [Paenibacillus lutimineralis]MCM3647030.1 hypothetical protein [Paenibacillus motobuensis]
MSVNVGIALGSTLGGFVTTSSRLIDVSWCGGLVAIAAAVLAGISYRLDHHSSQLRSDPTGAKC